ncbi:ulp1 protease family, C-terminal catalytic domain-containing protein [Tanacetum coccineum]
MDLRSEIASRKHDTKIDPSSIQGDDFIFGTGEYETFGSTLWIDANVIDCWVALLNFEELALGYPTPTRHFFPTGCIIKGLLHEEDSGKSFLDEIKAQFKYEPSSMSLSDFELKKLFSRYLKEQNHSSHEAVSKMRPFIPKLKWRTSNNHVDCGVFAMIHMENYVGDAPKNWEFGLCEESDEQLSMLQRLSCRCERSFDQGRKGRHKK